MDARMPKNLKHGHISPLYNKLIYCEIARLAIDFSVNFMFFYARKWREKVCKRALGATLARMRAADRKTTAVGPVGRVRQLGRAGLEPARWCGGRRSANGCLLVPAAYVLPVLLVLPVLPTVIRDSVARIRGSAISSFIFHHSFSPFCFLRFGGVCYIPKRKAGKWNATKY